MGSTSPRFQILGLFLIFISLFCTFSFAEFGVRTIPTAIDSHSTQFDGIIICPGPCSDKDKLQLKFTSTSTKLATHISPKKFTATFFLSTTDEIVATVEGSFKDLVTETLKIKFTSTQPASTRLRLVGTVEYSSIASDAQSKVEKPLLSFEYFQPTSLEMFHVNDLLPKPEHGLIDEKTEDRLTIQQTSSLTAHGDIYFTKHLADVSSYNIDLLRDINDNTYHMFATIQHLPFETNHIILYPYGALRSSPGFDQTKVECSINSLKFNVSPVKTILGDFYYQLTLSKTPYLLSYHFPTRIDIAIQCVFGHILPNQKVPFGMGLQFIPRSDGAVPSLDHEPIAVVTGNDISVIHWHDDFINSYKFLFNFDSYQASYVPYTIKSDDDKKKTNSQSITQYGMTEDDIIAQFNNQPLQRLSSPSLTHVSVDKDDTKSVYRSHYSYLFRIMGASIEFDSSDAWFELKVQNTRQAKHIATTWTHFVTKTLSTDKTIKDVTMLATATMEPLDSTRQDQDNQFRYPNFSFSVSKEQAQKYKSPVSFISIQIVLEHDTLPHVRELHPASIGLTMNRKVKKYADQPLSVFKHLAVVSYPYSKTFVKDLKDFQVIPTLVETTGDEKNLRKYSIQVTIDAPTENSDLIHFQLGSQEYFFEGDFTTCKFGNTLVAGATSYNSPFKGVNGYIVSFSLPDKSDIVVKDQKLTISCPNGYLLSSNDSQKEPDFYHDNIFFALLGYDLEGEKTSLGAHYVSTRIAFTDHFYEPKDTPTGMGIASVLIVLCLLVTIGSLCYLAWKNREHLPFLKRFSNPSAPVPNTSINGDRLDDLTVSEQYQPPSL